MRNSLCDLVVDAIDAGTAGKLFIRLTGSTADAPSANPAAELTFSATAFDDAGTTGGNAAGVATAEPITSDTSAVGGTAAFATLETSAGVVCAHCNVTLTGSGGDIIASSLSIGATDTVSCSTLTYESAN